MIEIENYKQTKLNEVIKYCNENIINRFIKENPSISYDDGKIIFIETLKWIWLCNEFNSENKSNFRLFIYEDSLVIDKMWHNFILFTREYHNFCNKYFGRYIHHSPNVKQNNDDLDYETKLSELYSYIYDKLGEETLNLWFREFPEKFN